MNKKSLIRWYLPLKYYKCNIGYRTKKETLVWFSVALRNNYSKDFIPTKLKITIEEIK